MSEEAYRVGQAKVLALTTDATAGTAEVILPQRKLQRRRPSKKCWVPVAASVLPAAGVVTPVLWQDSDSPTAPVVDQDTDEMTRSKSLAQLWVYKPDELLTDEARLRHRGHPDPAGPDAAEGTGGGDRGLVRAGTAHRAGERRRRASLTTGN
ncbi:hypothetical protein [Amycolatopsis magusensis]|uniref:hypothetical protein n=1 Tax=Amycolatopsis magusensis TaxID=882444 RepID=UPI00378D7808